MNTKFLNPRAVLCRGGRESRRLAFVVNLT